MAMYQKQTPPANHGRWLRRERDGWRAWDVSLNWNSGALVGARSAKLLLLRGKDIEIDMAKRTHGNRWKDGWHFLCTYTKDKHFHDLLYPLVEKWQSPYYKQQLGLWFNYKNDADIKGRNAKAFLQRYEFLDGLDVEKRKAFFTDIVAILTEYNLGDEWFSTFADLIISGWLCPPTHHLDIRTVGAGSKKRVVLTLNADTTIDDVREAWQEIRQQQKEAWPEFRKRRKFDMRSFKNYMVALRDLRERRFARERRESDTKDLDLVGKLWEDVDDISLRADKKRRANLRTIRRRFGGNQA